MIDEPQQPTFGEKELPRWIQVLAGMVLGLITLFCAFAFVMLFFSPDRKHYPFVLVVGLVFLLPCFWVLEKCFRLVTGRKKQGGLLSPNALRVVAFFLLVLPIIGLFTGYYRETGPLAIFQPVIYLFGFFGVRALARKREAEVLSSKRENGAGNRT